MNKYITYIKCEVCGKKKEIWKSVLKRYRPKFCSMKCYGKSCLGRKVWNKGKKTGKNQLLSIKLKELYKTHLSGGYIDGRSKNSEYHKEYDKNYRKKNSKRIYHLNLKRYALKKNNGGGHTYGEWENLLYQYNFTCPCCKKSEPDIVLTQDHIIPLSRGGSDNIENIQPLCKACNSGKHTKIVKYG